MPSSNSERHHTWTPCEMYGHAFDNETGRCECGEQRDEFDDGSPEDVIDVGDPSSGKTRLLAERCATCILRPAGTRIELDNERVAAFVRDALDNDSYVVCHATLPVTAPEGVLPAVCRGFYDRYRTTDMTLMERLWGFIEVPAPTTEKETA